MQKTLTFTKDKKKYVSKVFDFKAMCLINDKQNTKGCEGPLSMCADALDYMFEGTEATQDIIESLRPGVRANLCLELWKMFGDELTEKKE